jgi:hypothetical protein
MLKKRKTKIQGKINKKNNYKGIIGTMGKI